ncbi:hypothetical protein RND71_022004 [Anisodus tanguticus]|uniref:Uncharacterized protein n=1 Tax=Anisodus tanguticus TaxID=243964 RepID=A0AAE1RY32_9SOLA|nr:hypothetical protein RND71_022004 [Anisodus tanguticus]
MANPEYFTIVDTLKPDLIMYDFLHPCIPTMVATLLIPAVLFLTHGAASNSYHHHGRINNPSFEYPFPKIFFHDHEHRKNKKIFDSLENEGIDNKNGVTRCFKRSKEIILIKSWKQISEVLPEGYFERIENRGIIIENWASHGRILEHSSIGGFVSHCGWGSVIEALNYGVPIIAMPMQHDQPRNGRLLVNEVGVGLEIHRDEEGKFDKEVAKIVREVVLEKSGERLREKAKEFSEIMRENGENDIHGLVEELLKLCRETIIITLDKSTKKCLV